MKKARAHSQSQPSIWSSIGFLSGIRGESEETVGGRGGTVAKAVRFKSTMESELEQGVARLQSLREEAAAQPPDANREHMQQPEEEVSRFRARVAELECAQRTEFSATHPTTAAEEVNRLRATVEELRRERNSLMSEIAERFQPY